MTRFPWLRWATWTAILLAVTAALLEVRARLDKAHLILVYLLVVLAGTVRGGRALGLALAAAGFLLFNWFFLPPYNTLAISDPLDWLVLLAYLLVSATVAQMLHRREAEARLAAERAAEVDRFAGLGADALTVGRAEEAVHGVAETIRGTLGLRQCVIHRLTDGTPQEEPLATWTAQHGRAAIRMADGTVRLMEEAGLPARVPDEAAEAYLPLLVRGRAVGVLHLTGAGPIVLSHPQQRFLAALAHYGALAVERARLESEAGRVEVLREADRMKDALLASVSHDLRTPLTTIKALAHDLAGADDRALTIEEEADRLNRLVADLLDLTRLRGGHVPLTIEVNAVDDLVGGALQRAAGLMRERRIEVRMEDGGTLLVGRFDLSHAVRILVNLLENAHKYSPPGAAIEVAARAEGPVLRLEVADRGPGVRPDEADRIFDPFYRSAGALPDAAGTGLGLAIARQLARLMGGDVTVASRANGGAVFTLTLPSAPLPALPAR